MEENQKPLQLENTETLNELNARKCFFKRTWRHAP